MSRGERTQTVTKLVESFQKSLLEKTTPLSALAEALAEAERKNDRLESLLALSKEGTDRVKKAAVANEEQLRSYIYRLESELKLHIQQKKTAEELIDELVRQLDAQRRERIMAASIETDTLFGKIDTQALISENKELKARILKQGKDLKKTKKANIDALKTIRIYESILENAGLDI